MFKIKFIIILFYYYFIFRKMDIEIEKTLEKYILTQVTWDRLPNEIKAKLQVCWKKKIEINKKKNNNKNKQK